MEANWLDSTRRSQAEEAAGVARCGGEGGVLDLDGLEASDVGGLDDVCTG